jgi:TolB protein
LGENALSGTLVIQSSPGGMLYAYSLESGSLWPLSNGFDPAISPDGQTVAFVREGGENGIYLIDTDGSNERLIFSGRARLSSPKWSPDGQWILFTRSDGEYHCLDLGGNCITPPSGPNGEQISIPGVDSVTRYWYNLARVDRDGNNYRDIASLTSARAADWNEAGIVYQSDAGLQITDDAPDAENTLVIFDYLKPFFDDPDWQRNGGRIVYMGKEASHWELFAVNVDGSDKRALTRPKTTIVDEIPSNVAPAWSPNGQTIAFLSNRESNGEAGAWRVWVMDADGSNQRALPIDLAIHYTFGGEQSLSWAR